MTNEKSIDIFCIEDNDVSRFALKSMLRKVPDFSLVGEASDGRSALQLLTQVTPGIVLCDIGLPDIDGIELTKEIKTMLPEARVLMLTASDDENDIFDALDAGADGYILKAENGDHVDHARNLETAIRSVKLGAVWLDPAIARLVLKSTQRPSTPRNRRVEPISLSSQERNVLGQVAESNCQDGVCLVDPDFLQNLRRFGNFARRTAEQAMKAPAP